MKRRRYLKRLTTLVLTLILSVSCLGTAAQAATLQEQFEDEMHQARYITSRGAAYTLDTIVPYQHYWFQVGWTVDKSNGGDINSVKNGLIDKNGNPVKNAGSPEEIIGNLKKLRESLVKVVDDPEEVCWYIWEDGTPKNMPQEDGVAELDFDNTFDEAGFVPFLVPYMLEDQSQVKGNAILVAGGGMSQRCHDYEGDASAAVLNELGYNCFILQRRVAPFAAVDCSIDLQRAVRYLRYHAKDYGIGSIDNLFTIGFSGGGDTITTQLNTCYGNITPNAIYPTYVCDDIDKINSDYKVAALFYGAPANYSTQNPNMPSLFLAVGTEDGAAYGNVMAMYAQAHEQGWNPQLYVASNAPHGFALTGVRAFTNEGTTTAKIAPLILDTYLQVQFGLLPATF